MYVELSELTQGIEKFVSYRFLSLQRRPHLNEVFLITKEDKMTFIAKSASTFSKSS